MAGPFAAQRLGDLGADVIKIEPTAGEWQRFAAAGGAMGNEINVSFLSLNRNKRSVALDLKSRRGQDCAAGARRERPTSSCRTTGPASPRASASTTSRFGPINPAIVYVSISGYGEDGPYRDRPGQDLLVQAMSGAMLSHGRAGDAPAPAGQYLADAVTASTAFEGVLAALLHRERTGEGQLVTVNMLDAVTTLQMQELSVFTVGGKPQQRSEEPHAHVYIRAPYGVFRTSDGFLALAFADPRAARATDRRARLRGLGRARSRDGPSATSCRRSSRPSCSRSRPQYWLETLGGAGMWVGPVYGYEELVADPQIIHNGTFIEYDHPTEGHVKTPGFPYRFSKTPPRVERGAPLVGEHTREVLSRRDTRPPTSTC